MKKILEYITYISEAVSAISKGAKVTSDFWPTYNPFGGQGDLAKQQGQPDQPSGDLPKSVQKPI